MKKSPTKISVSDDESEQLIDSVGSPRTETTIFSEDEAENSLFSEESKTLFSVSEDEKNVEFTNDTSVEFEEVFSNKLKRMNEIADRWRDNFFDLARLCIENYVTNKPNDRYLRRLEIYLGPKNYPCVTKQKAQEQDLLLAWFKEHVKHKLWICIGDAIVARECAWNNGILMSRRTQSSTAYRVVSNGDIILSAQEATEFLRMIEGDVIPKWEKECIIDFGGKFISNNVYRLIDQQQYKEGVEIRVNRAYKTQFTKFLKKLRSSYEEDDCIGNFTRNLNMSRLKET